MDTADVALCNKTAQLLVHLSGRKQKAGRRAGGGHRLSIASSINGSHRLSMTYTIKWFSSIIDDLLYKWFSSVIDDLHYKMVLIDYR